MKRNRFQAKNALTICIGILSICLLVLSSCSKKDDNGTSPGDQNKPVMYSGTAKPSSDNVQTSATGSVTAEYDPATKKLSFTFTWSGLTSKIGGFHIHKGDGAIIVPFDAGSYPTTTSGTFSGETTLTDDSWIADLTAGKLYGQIHTENFPGGEIIFPIQKGGNNDGGDNGSGGDNGGGYDYPRNGG